MKDFWNTRYSSPQYAYGTEANEYFKSQIDKIPVGKILLPAEGEGRNAVYAAQRGWQASAFDISEEGMKKALQLAQKIGVDINYKTEILENLHYNQNEFDAIALIYAHFPANIKSNYHQLLNQYLKKDGYIIFEAFSKKHLEYNSTNPKVGGPKDIDMLFSIDEIKNDFKNYKIITLTETEIDLNEGEYHKGKGMVIRLLGQKK